MVCVWSHAARPASPRRGCRHACRRAAQRPPRLALTRAAPVSVQVGELVNLGVMLGASAVSALIILGIKPCSDSIELGDAAWQALEFSARLEM